MTLFVQPNIELANLEPGSLFMWNNKRFMVIKHSVNFVAIERFTWFDMLLSKLVTKIREKIRKIKLGIRIKKGDSLEREPTKQKLS